MAKQNFMMLLRVLLPSNEGISLSSIGSAQTYQYENTINTVWNKINRNTVVFIQSSVTKEI